MVRYMFHKKWNVIVDFIHFSQKIFWQKVILVSDLWTCARSRRRRRTSSTWTRSTTSAPWHARQVPSMSFDSNNPSLPIIYYKPLLFMYSCMWIGKLFNSHIFGTNLTYCHWFEHNGEYFLNFLRRFSGFWKPICQRPSWISWSFRKKFSMEYTMYIIHARKYTVMICEVTTGGKDWPQVDQGGVFQTINYPQHLLHTYFLFGFEKASTSSKIPFVSVNR